MGGERGGFYRCNRSTRRKGPHRIPSHGPGYTPNPPGRSADDVPEGKAGGKEEAIHVPAGWPVPGEGEAAVPVHPGEPARAPCRPDIDMPASPEADLPEAPDREGARAVPEDEGVDAPIHGAAQSPSAPPRCAGSPPPAPDPHGPHRLRGPSIQRVSGGRPSGP